MVDPSPPEPPPPGAAGLGRRLAAGIGTLGGGLVLWSVLQFVAVAVLAGHWGTERYGRWLTLNAAANLLALLDLGLQVHLTSLMRAAAARGDGERLRRVLGEGLTIYAAVLGLGAVLGLPALALFASGGGDAESVLTVLMLGTTALILLPRGLVGCIFSARGQLSTEAMLGSAQQMLPLAALLAAVLMGAGPAAAAGVQLAGAVLVGWGLLLVVLRRSHPDIRLRFARPKPGTLSGYAAKSVLHGIPGGAAQLLLQVPVLALGALFPSGSAVVAFTTIRTYANLLRQMATQISVAVGLEMVRQHAQDDRDGLTRLFAASSRALGGGTGLAAGLLLWAGEPFFRLWTRGAASFEPATAAAFIAVTLLTLPAGLIAVALRHADEASPLARLSTVQTVLGLALLAGLVPTFGAAGAAWAVALAEAAVLGGSAPRLARALLRFTPSPVPAWGAAAAGLIVGWGAAALLGRLLPGDRLEDLLLLGTAWAMLLAPPAVFLLFSAPLRARLAGGAVAMVRRAGRMS